MWQKLLVISVEAVCGNFPLESAQIRDKGLLMTKLYVMQFSCVPIEKVELAQKIMILQPAVVMVVTDIRCGY